MTNVVNLMAKCHFDGIKLSPDSDGDLTIDAPKDVLTPELIEDLRAQKCDLLAFLRSDPVTPETRRQVYSQMMERVNAKYEGWPIDWDELIELDQRIRTAETFDELILAVEVYEIRVGI